MKLTQRSRKVTAFKYIVFTSLSRKSDTSLENWAGRWLLGRGCLRLWKAHTTSSSRKASYSENTFDYSVKVPFYAVSELTTEMQKANSRCGMQLSEVWPRTLVHPPGVLLAISWTYGGTWTSRKFSFRVARQETTFQAKQSTNRQRLSLSAKNYDHPDNNPNFVSSQRDLVTMAIAIDKGVCYLHFVWIHHIFSQPNLDKISFTSWSGSNTIPIVGPSHLHPNLDQIFYTSRFGLNMFFFRFG